MTARPTPQQRAEMAAYIDAKEPGWLDELGISREQGTQQCIGCLVDSQPHTCGFNPAVIPTAWRD